jgi:hypothetical protein
MARPANCRMCDRLLRPQRHAPGTPGVSHDCRGLCAACRVTARRLGITEQFPPIGFMGGTPFRRPARNLDIPQARREEYTMERPANCRMCDRLLRPRRHAPGTPGVSHDCRGLCAACRVTAKRLGITEQFPPIGFMGGNPGGILTRQPAEARQPQLPRRSRTSIIEEDFVFLVEQNGGERNATIIGWTPRTRRLVAQRLGIPQRTLDRALYHEAKKRTNAGFIELEGIAA